MTPTLALSDLLATLTASPRRITGAETIILIRALRDNEVKTKQLRPILHVHDFAIVRSASGI